MHKGTGVVVFQEGLGAQLIECYIAQSLTLIGVGVWKGVDLHDLVLPLTYRPA